jgi:hypothetical protein
VSEEAAVTGLAAEVTEDAAPPQSRQRRWTDVWTGRRAVALTVAVYLLGAFYVTAKLWVDPAGRWQFGDVEDTNQATWFMRYAANAIEHFRLPALITPTMNAPHNVNLMWNTPLLLAGSIVTPVTALFGPQVSLTVILVLSFAGSATSMFYVLRKWNASLIAAALGGAMYGFSPALIQSGIGHYSLVIGILPPLLLDRAARIITGKGNPIRNGLWLGVLAAAQIFISEEALVDTAIGAGILLIVLIACRPREVPARLRSAAIGLGTAAVAGLILGGRALWVQFHGVIVKDAAATVVIWYQNRWTNLGTIPYAFITPSSRVVLHTIPTAQSASHYPQPTPEYLAYLGVPLIIVLLAAIVLFWRYLPVRVAGITCVALEWLGLGARQLNPHAVTLPGFLLPWTYLDKLPVISGMVPDRLCITADIMGAAVLAFSIDLAWKSAGPFANWENAGKVAAVVAALSLIFIVPSPYTTKPVPRVPAGWRATFAALHLTPTTRVLMAPFPDADTSSVIRWAATTNEPGTMIGGDFITPDASALDSRAGRSALNPLADYLTDLYWLHGPMTAPPSSAVVKANLASMQPQAVVAVATPTNRLGKYLISLFGQPTADNGDVMGWRL